MNKILIILFSILLMLPSLNTNAQIIKIDTITITDSILCNGDEATINIQITQTTPPDPITIIVGYYSSGFWVPFYTTAYSNWSSFSFPTLVSRNWSILLVDSIPYYATSPPGANPSSIHDSTSINIPEPPPISISQTILPATNPLTTDGSISLVVSGGTPPYNFSWMGPNGFTSSLEDIVNLRSGVYIDTITDNRGCEKTDSYTVPATIACSYGQVDTVINPICHGDNNGKIVINEVFGAPDFIYKFYIQDPISLSFSQMGGSITIADSFYTLDNLIHGNYKYTVTDANGCFDPNPTIIHVQDPTQITRSSIIITEAADSTSCDGGITFGVGGGEPPFIHSWTGPNFFSSNSPPPITNLCAGTYIDSIVDSAGCNQVFSFSVPIEDTCSPLLEIHNIFCEDDSSGLVIATRTNNAYSSYQWKDTLTGIISHTDTFADNLPAGGYIFSAISFSGVPGACPDTNINFSIITPEINVSSLYGPKICAGVGTEFYFDTINTNPSFIYKLIISTDTLLSGEISSSSYLPGIYPYTIEVDTGNGFISCLTNQNIEIIESDLSLDAFTVTNEICATSLGSVEVFASSSYGIPFFTLLPFNLNSQFSNLFTVSSSYYTLLIEDGMCLISEDSIFVDLDINIVLDVDSSLETCRLNDGWIKVIAQGGYGGYRYSIDGGASFVPDTSMPSINSDTLLIDSLVQGNYHLVVKDDSLCEYDYGNIEIGRTLPTKIDSLVTKNESCCGWDGEITVFSTPQNSVAIYSIDTFFFGQSGNLIFQNSNIFDSLYRGDYLIRIEDTNGCFDSDTVTLDVDDSIRTQNISIEIKDVRCNGYDDGLLTVINPDQCYTYFELYRYNPGTAEVLLDTGNYFNTLTPGYYGIKSTSNSGTCRDSSVVKFIDEPDSISFNNSPLVTDVRCLNNNSCNGEIYLIPDAITGYPASGGTPPYYCYLTSQFYSQNWNIPLGLASSTDTFQSLCSGSYQMELKDQNNCNVFYDSIFIADSSLYIDSFLVQDVGCHNGNDGIIEVLVSGGLGNYSYLWSNSDITNIADSLSVSSPNPLQLWETYSISVTDSVGCFVDGAVRIEHPKKLTFSIVGGKDETCMGVTHDGEIYLNLNGGTPPYYHSWSSTILSGNSGFGYGDTIFNLTYDSILIVITDSNFCQSTSWVTQPEASVGALNSGNPLSLGNIDFTQNPICYGDYTAFIDIDVDDGDAPFQYSIDPLIDSNWSTLNSFAMLNAGKYNIYVQDVYGCLDSAIVDITEYPEIIINDLTKDVNCYEDSTGEISVTVTGGVSPFAFSWIGPNGFTSVSEDISGLHAGPYVIKVTDDSPLHCFVVDTIVLIELTEPIQTITSVVNIVNCYGDSTGALSDSTIGGMPPYNFTWTDASGVDWTNNSVVNPTSSSIYGLPAGTYTCTVSDSYNCGPASDVITLTSNSEVEIDTLNRIHNICFRGDIGELTFAVSGGVPNYLISLVDEDDNTITSNSTTFTNLSSSTYMVWVTDSNQCFSDTILDLKIREPGRTQILNNNIDSLSCYDSEDGVINLSFFSGTPPYNYVVEYDNMIIAQSQVNDSFFPFDLEGLSAGEYTIYVTDFRSCPSVDTVLNVYQPDSLFADFNSSSGYTGRKTFDFKAESFNSTEGDNILYYWYFSNDSIKQQLLHDIHMNKYINHHLGLHMDSDYWNLDQENPLNGGLWRYIIEDTIIKSSQEIEKPFPNQGEYKVWMVVHDTELGHQCNDTTDMKVIQVEGYDVSNVFTPNNDGKNDIFYFNDWMLDKIYVRIYNRWGERIYHWDNVNSGWEGRSYSGENVEEGVYFYRLKATAEDGTVFRENGSITLIR